MLAGGTQDARTLKSELLQRLNNEGLRFYQPHRQQLAFHKSLAEKRALFGGNQSGKSYGGALEMAWTVGRVHPFRPNYTTNVFGRDCCVSLGVLDTVILPTYKRLLPRREAVLNGYDYEIRGEWFSIPASTLEGRERRWPGLDGGNWDKAYDKERHILYLADGSFVEFKTYEQGSKNPDVFAGPPRHIIRHDEEPPLRLFNENQARQVTTGVNMVFTMTPLNYSLWLYSQIIEGSARDEHIDLFKMASAENPFAKPEALEAMERDIVDPAERAARLYGEPTFLEGRVWKGYGDHNLVDPFDIPKDWHRSVVIDPHPQKPTAVNWFAQGDDGVVYCYREADISGDVEHICNTIIAECGAERIDLWLIDPSANQRAKIHGKGRLIDEFRKFIKWVVPANNNRELGWQTVATTVKDRQPGGPRFKVFRSCSVTDHQMRNYSWKPPTRTGEDRTKPEVYKKGEDHCDNVRYRLMWGGIKSFWEDDQPWKIGVYANG